MKNNLLFKIKMSDTNYTDYLKTCSTWRANHSNKSSDMLQDYEEKFKIRELNRQIDEKNDEIYKLRYDLDDTLKIKEDLIFDLESVERELDYVKNKARETEDALLTKIRILEIEKKHFEERYLLRDQSKYLNTSPRNFYKTDRTETKTEENKCTDICLNFVNKFQNILLKEKDRKYFNNYNTNELELREKLILIENELLNILTEKNLEKLEIEKQEKNVSSSQVFTHKLKELSEENEKLSYILHNNIVIKYKSCTVWQVRKKEKSKKITRGHLQRQKRKR
jgi:hypothetical protein